MCTRFINSPREDDPSRIESSVSLGGASGSAPTSISFLHARFTSSVNWEPFLRIPNVKRFIVKTGDLDELFDLFGVRKKVQATFEWSPYKNGSAIRYAGYMITRLQNTKSDALF